MLYPSTRIIYTEPLFLPLPEEYPITSDQTSSLDKHMACANFPMELLSIIQVVIQTGAEEKEKTKNLLDTMASCVDNALIVSDVEDVVSGHRVLDILSKLPPTYSTDNPD